MPIWPFKKKVETQPNPDAVSYLGGPPQKAPHETPYGGYTEEQMAYINRRKGGYANPGSPLWVYREKIADRERKKLPHVKRAARWGALATIAALICAAVSTLPNLHVIWRFVILSAPAALAVSAILDAWTPVRYMEEQPRRIVLTVAICIAIVLMLPLAIWINSLENTATENSQKATAPHYDQRRPTVTNGAVRRPGEAPVLNHQR